MSKLINKMGYVARSFYVIPGGYYLSKIAEKISNIVSGKIGGLKEFKFNGIKYRIDTDLDLSKKLFWRGAHEWNPIFALQKFVKQGDVVLDIGANQGEFTLWLSKLVGQKGKVYSFEPLTKMFSALQWHIDNNKPTTANVVIINAGLSNKSEMLPIYQGNEENNEGFASIFKETEADKLIETVQILHPDDVAEEYGIKKVDFVKLDVEGAEFHVLLGLKKIVLRDRPIILIEVNEQTLQFAGVSLKQLFSYFKEINYELFEVKRRGVLLPFNFKSPPALCNAIAKAK